MWAKVHVTPDLVVRLLPAGWRDLGALYHLERVCFGPDAWPWWDLVAVLTWPRVVRLKAVVEGRMVGFIAGDARTSPAWIATLGVLPAYRRRGIGRALLAACEAQLPRGPVRLSVRVSNQPARRLYESMGYRPIGLWRAYYSDREDALVMEKTLT